MIKLKSYEQQLIGAEQAELERQSSQAKVPLSSDERRLIGAAIQARTQRPHF